MAARQPLILHCGPTMVNANSTLPRHTRPDRFERLDVCLAVDAPPAGLGWINTHSLASRTGQLVQWSDYGPS
jgi:hypothetical protein